MSSHERTFVMIKPDAVERGLTGKILSRIERKGFKIIGMKFLRMTKTKAEELYAPHKGKPFFLPLLEFITSAPLVVLALEGPDCIRQIRKLMGSTNCAEAEPGTIRGDFGVSIQNNLIHGSDSSESAKREMAVFFAEQELVSYQRTVEKWISPAPASVH
ncbi:MAG: nucleoside-diphosphate kinase [Firmicutes bacterium]|nr:nucleoside-diphosphate kinase [Bacillota bacterium]